MFTVSKTAQVASVFTKSAGGTINILKLIKLIYLSERESLKLHGMPLIFDQLVSMDNGPVPSQTLNLINGFVGKEEASEWDKWICDRDNHFVALVNDDFKVEALDQLSESDLEILSFIWTNFGHMDQWQLVEYTHQHCPEWSDPHGSSTPIKIKDLFTSVGFSTLEAEEQATEIEQLKDIDRIFASL